MKPVRVVVVGGGFGGRAVAEALDAAAAPGGAIALDWVRPGERQAISPLLFELVGGQLPLAGASWDQARLLRHGRSHLSLVVGLDLKGRQVELASGRPLPYDQLVLATGLPPRRLPALGPEALTFQSLEDALALKSRLGQVCSVAVVGGGSVGVELACELAASWAPRRAGARGLVSLVEAGPELLPQASPALRGAARARLAQLGVGLRLGQPAVAWSAGALRLAEGSALPAELVVQALGKGPDPWLRALNLPWTAEGRLVVGPELQVQDRPGLWALGDVAAVPDPEGGGRPLALLAQHAARQGPLLAANLLASLQGEALRPYWPPRLGSFMHLGGAAAAGELLGWALPGAAASAMRRAYYLAALAGPAEAQAQAEAYLKGALPPWLSGCFPPPVDPAGC